MFGGNRLHYLVLGGWLVLAVLVTIPALGVPPESQRISEGKPAEGSAAATPAEDGQEQPQQPAAVTAPVEQPAQTENAESEAGDSDYYLKEDLKAQQAMAGATDRIVTWTKVQIGLGVAGTFFLLWTLLETRRATNLASDTAQRQLRAYIGVKAAWIDFTDLRNPTATVNMSNFGQTPAYDMRWWIHSWIEAFPLKVELPEASDDLPMGCSMEPPGIYSTQEIPLGVPMNDWSLNELSEERAAIYIYGKVTYRDVFNISRETRYCLFFKGNDFGPNRRLAPYMEGNEST